MFNLNKCLNLHAILNIMELNEKQIEILEIAEALFAKNSYEGTSIRDIAQAANINVAMVNYYFGSKEGLLETIIKNGVQQYVLDPSQYNFEEEPIARLDRMIEHYVQSKLKNQFVYHILMTEASIKKRLIHSDTFKELRKQNIKHINDVIVYGKEKGVFNDYNPILIHTTMIGTFMNFNFNKSFFEEYLPNLTEKDFDEYLADTIIKHLKFTIKAILSYENE